jgi:hypothetical protein
MSYICYVIKKSKNMINFVEELKKTKTLTIPTNKLKILSREKIELDGKQLTLSPTAFNDLLSIVGLTNKTVNHLNKNLDNAGFTIVKALMNATSKSYGNVSLLINTDTLEIVRVNQPEMMKGAIVSPDLIQDLINDIVIKNDNIKLSSAYITDGGTRATFNLKLDQPHNIGIRGEDIAIGKQVQWDLLNAVQLNDFIERLICANGMTRTGISKSTFLNADSSASEWYNKLYSGIVNPEKEYITKYSEKVKEARNTNLSVLEYNKIKSHLYDNWSGDKNRITRYLGDESWNSDYLNRGIKLEQLSTEQLRNCPTPINSWNAINCLTDLASHDYNTPVSALTKSKTQFMAGRLLNNTWDANRHIYNVPNYMVTEPEEVFVRSN